MITGRSRAPEVHGLADDDLHDLDELDASGAGDAHDVPADDDEGGPAVGRLRRRGLAAGVVVVVALLGAALGSAHAGARAAQVEQGLRLDAALRTGQVGLDGSVSSVGDAELTTASVPLVNTGAQAVSARLVAFEAPHLGRFHLPGASGEAPAAVTIAPGGALSVQAAAEVRCEDVPAADPYGQSSGAPEPAAVVVDVSPAGDDPAGGGPGRRVRLPLAADEALQLAAQLTWTCHPDSGPSSPQVSYTWLPDGRLRVDLVNGAAPGAPAKITATSTTGVELTSSPQLPLVLQPGGSQELLLSARVDCAAVGDGSSSGVVLNSEQVVDGGAPPGSTTTDLGFGSTGDGSPYGPSGWLTRRIALACG